MNQLIQVRQNIFYTKQEGEFVKGREIILVVDEVNYKRTNEGDVIRERGCKEIRFVLNSDDAFEALIEALTNLKNAKEEDLS
jgi:hypothetical protein